MRTLRSCFFAAIVVGLLACGSLSADTITIADLPNGDVDTLSITLVPLNGAVDGAPGSTVGWGFQVTWTSTGGDWISFTGSDVSSQPQTDSSVLGSYSDFIGAQGGPVDFGLAPGTWSEDFDGSSQGVGAFTIADGAVPGAIDIGNLTFYFQVYDGDPLEASQIGDDSYSYSGNSTNFSVAVDPVTPEPASLLLLASGLGGMYFRRRKAAARS